MLGDFNVMVNSLDLKHHTGSGWELAHGRGPDHIYVLSQRAWSK